MFLIPSDFGARTKRSDMKNGDERLVVLNSVAKSIIDKRGAKARIGYSHTTAPRCMNERLSLEEGAGESDETLAGGKPSPRSPWVCIHQGA